MHNSASIDDDIESPCKIVPDTLYFFYKVAFLYDSTNTTWRSPECNTTSESPDDVMEQFGEAS